MLAGDYHSLAILLTTEYFVISLQVLQSTQNLLDPKEESYVALPPGDIDILPCKLIDRTHHVTERVTQVSVIHIHMTGGEGNSGKECRGQEKDMVCLR